MLAPFLEIESSANRFLAPQQDAQKDLRALLDAVREAVERAVGWERGRPFVFQGEIFSCDALLGLLSYSYARGIYASEDIEASLAEDAIAQDLCAGAMPDRNTMRRFRRVYRETVKRCLVHVLGQTGRVPAVSPGRSFFETPVSSGVPLVSWEGCGVADPTESEAEERITRAVFMDGMAIAD